MRNLRHRKNFLRSSHPTVPASQLSPAEVFDMEQKFSYSNFYSALKEANEMRIARAAERERIKRRHAELEEEGRQRLELRRQAKLQRLAEKKNSNIRLKI